MPRYDYECPNPECPSYEMVTEVDCKWDEKIRCGKCFIIMRKIITKMPLRTYTKRPQDRLWGTSHLSSSEKFKEKQKRKGEKK